MAAHGLNTQYLLIRQPEDYNINTFGLNKADLSKFIYLCTYTDFLTGRIVYDNGRTIKRKDIYRLLNLSERRGRELINKLIDNEALKEINDVIFLNKELTKIGYTGKNENNYVKLHKLSYRKIYESIDIRSYQKLSNVYLSLPYLNLYTNVLTGTDNKPMKSKDTSIILGYSAVDKFTNQIKGLTLNGAPVFEHIDTGDKRVKNIKVNENLIHPKKDDDRFDYNVYSNTRNAKIRMLVDDFTEEQKEELLERFNNRCAFTGKEVKLHVDHVIPLSWEIEGNTLSNMLPLSKYVNVSKSDKNVFKWYEQNKDKYEVKEDLFVNAITYIANLMNMDYEEYKDYVYHCEKIKDDIDDDYILEMKNELDDLISERDKLNNEIRKIKHKLNKYKASRA